jgi:hypothetical protein
MISHIAHLQAIEHERTLSRVLIRTWKTSWSSRPNLRKSEAVSCKSAKIEVQGSRNPLVASTTARSLIRCDVASDSHLSKVGVCTYCLGPPHLGKLIVASSEKGGMEPQLRGGDLIWGLFFGVIAFLSPNPSTCMVGRSVVPCGLLALLLPSSARAVR